MINKISMLYKIIGRPVIICICLLAVCKSVSALQWNPNYTIGTTTGNYNFSNNTIPDPLTEIYPAVLPNDNLAGAFTFQWQHSSMPLSGFSDIAGATSSDYHFSAPLAQTMYYRRITTYVGPVIFFVHLGNTLSVYSNIIKISIVSVNWEDINYIRKHDVLISGITTPQQVDQLPIGQKFQTTSYMDGLGRSTEKIGKGTVTPPTNSSNWGDMVIFSQYDEMGRENKHYLPYTTTSETGKFKASPIADQANYYANAYNESYTYTSVTFDNSPLNRVTNIKEPGIAWNTATLPSTTVPLGKSNVYSVNTLSDNVQIFSVDYVQGDAPIDNGPYSANTLYKMSYTDDNNKQVIEYTNKSGQLVLKKVQVDNTPSAAHAGWACTYYIYDDFGLLSFQLSPDAVDYLDNHNWSFAGTNGQQVLNEWCFQYSYDDKGRAVWKKSPGAKPLNVLYDNRDRVVFSQDGNQSDLSVAQWTAYLYDELDRPVITALYNTNTGIAGLQTNINNSTATGPVSTTIPAVPLIDLVEPFRNTAIPAYQAQNSIEFVAGFNSVGGDDFSATINSSAVTQTGTIITTVTGSPITVADLNNPSVTTIIKYQFYDNYTFPSARSFDNNSSNTTAYNTNDPNVLPLIASTHTISMLTGTSVRILGTNTFLTSTYYYDERSNHIQTLEDNIMQGWDDKTIQYHWDGRVLSTYERHSTPNTGYDNFSILTRNIFDQIGRVISLQKAYGTNPFKTIASYDYDDMGRLKTKHLDPGYQNTTTGKNELEALTYGFNIHGQLTGINKDYALKTSGLYNKWGNYFGLYLGYDNLDNVFNNQQLDGHVTGQLWNTQGDDAQRKYDYTYDNAGRLSNAAYTEKQTPNDTWDNSKMDFSVSGSSGKIEYDLNGNLLSMLQKGVIAGQAPVTIDDLHYRYAAFSNKLLAVTDNATTTANGKFGDFKEGNNGPSDDYVYDDNGNLIVDLNKNVTGTSGSSPGIIYNFLDKPELINITGKGTLKIVYDADGNKIQKIFTAQGGNSGVKTTTYINEFVYEQITGGTSPQAGPSLSYINFEEGRIRVIQAVNQQPDNYTSVVMDGNMDLPNGKRGTYDYYVRDQQENVRVILTEETHASMGTCTMEQSRSGIESPIFGQVDATTGQPTAANEVEQTRTSISQIPGQSGGGGWQNSSIQSYVSMLSKGTHTTGPNSLLKVMAGDQITASTQYYYQNAVTNNVTDNSLATDVLSSLLGVLTGSSTTRVLASEGNPSYLTNQVNTSPSAPFSSIVNPDANNTSGSSPKAYLTILFFDERFNFVQEGSISTRATSAGLSSEGDILGLVNIKAPKNGYVYVYVSNEDAQPVYFDNLKVSDNRARIIEENHYYAYGLKIAAISSVKAGDPNEGTLKNNNKYNDKELWDDGDLNWYDYGFRSYDAQIGRFIQQDPMCDYYSELSPYQYAANDPINNVDIYGLFPGGGLVVTAPARMIVTTIPAEIGEIASVASVVSTSVSTITAVTTSLNFINIASMTLTTVNVLVTAVNTSNLINGSITTPSSPTWASKTGVGVHQTANDNAVFRVVQNEECGPVSDPSKKKRYHNMTNGLNDGTVEADTHQKGSESYMHAMRNDGKDGKETVEEAKENTNKFIRDNWKKAKEELAKGNEYLAYKYLGIAIHPLQDATSPAHNGFQPWHDGESFEDEMRHVLKEFIYPGESSNLQQVTNEYVTLFTTNGDLPDGDLLDGIHADPQTLTNSQIENVIKSKRLISLFLQAGITPGL